MLSAVRISHRHCRVGVIRVCTKYCHKADLFSAISIRLEFQQFVVVVIMSPSGGVYMAYGGRGANALRR